MDLTEGGDESSDEYGDEESSLMSDSTSDFERDREQEQTEYEEESFISEEVDQQQQGSSNYTGLKRGRPSTFSLTGLNGSSAQPNNQNLQYQLLTGSKRMLAKHRKHHRSKRASADARLEKSSKKINNTKAFMLLLKGFTGTGLVFLPKAFSNGGLLFSNIMIIFFSIMSYYCFVCLVDTTTRLGVSGYGEAGFRLYGSICKTAILISLAFSQLGFSSSYVVFVAENFQDVLGILLEDHAYSIGLLILLQLLLFVPLSLTRNIGKLGFTALIADAFILMGLVYIYIQSSAHLIDNGVSSKVSLFKQDTWTLFIGTSVFSFEGVGLLIPVQQSMTSPQDFNMLLKIVIGIVTVIIITLSSISYLSFGDDVKTVILMNFPRTPLALTIQVCYTLAILLSTPIQLFPAIKIVENFFFHKSRDHWKKKIRRDSEARSLLSNSNWDTLNYESTTSNFTPIKPSMSEESQAMSEGVINEEGIMSGKSDTSIKWMKNFIRVCVVLIMATIGYVGSSNLDNFVSLVGSFTCVPLIYIYPPLLYLNCFKEDIGGIARAVNYVILALGVVLMCYTSYQTIANW
ncbi:unnamed protein product [Ambrosiozyma monospora]|uniref:Unnamed protein product n=1 Tax=Ambrosiozyma monospora TaxID=43982 RepID=A0A9W6Z1Q2_AMBMO|nr:unnamed protein product [Ambrosiozyma monospora]